MGGIFLSAGMGRISVRVYKGIKVERGTVGSSRWGVLVSGIRRNELFGCSLIQGTSLSHLYLLPSSWFLLSKHKIRTIPVGSSAEGEGVLFHRSQEHVAF